MALILRKISEVIYSSTILPQVLQMLLTYITHLLVLNKARKRERKAIVYVSYRPQSTCKWVNYTVHCSTHDHLHFVSQNQQKIAIYSQKQLASHA